jgi:competence protein ComGD
MKTLASLTVLEMLLVLAVMMCFFLIPTLSIKGYQQYVEREHFFRQVEKEILLTQNFAIIGTHATQIRTYVKENKITFSASGIPAHFAELKCPPNVSVKRNIRVSFVKHSGNFSGEVRRIVFHNGGQNRGYQFQIGSGRYTEIK